MSKRRAAVTAWESLFRAQVSVMRRLNADFPADELSFNEYDVLLNLSREEGRRVRIKDLNRHLLLTQPSVSRLIDRLVSRGVIVKTVDPDDRRGVIVTMTDGGYELFRRVAMTHFETIVTAMGASLNVDELEQLTRLTNKLRGRADGHPRAEASTPT